MTKRYGFEMDKNCYKCICDTVDKKLYTDKKQVVDLLNAQEEKIQQIFKTIDEEITYKQSILELAEEQELNETIAKASFELATLKIMKTKFKKIVDNGPVE